MCQRRTRFQTVNGPAEGETVQLRLESERRCSNFPWWMLWMIWPALWLIKGLALVLGPTLAWLNQPLMLQITPLPLVLIIAGVVMLVIATQRRD